MNVSKTKMALWVAACVLIGGFVVYVVIRQSLSFDGAMNMQVARSLASGDGYARTYGDRAAFPWEVQSNAPFLLLSAVAIHLWGTKPWALELENGLYFVLLWMIYGRVLALSTRYRTSNPLPWIALALLMVFAAGSENFGFRGWGEVPALVYWSGAVLILASGRFQTGSLTNVFAFGALLAASVLVKRYMLLALVIAYFGLLIDRDLRFRALLAALVSLLTLFGWELVLYTGLGADVYHANQAALLSGIGERTLAGAAQPGVGWVFMRLEEAREQLAGWHLPAAWTLLTAGCLLLGAGLHLWHLLHKRERSICASNLVLFIILTTALAYIVWWTFLTPDYQMRLRRIYWWLLLGAALAAVWSLRQARIAISTNQTLSSIAASVLALSLLGLPLASPVLDEKSNRDFTLLAQIAERYAQGRPIFTGAGYPSSPGVGLQLVNHSQDLHTWTFSDLDRLYPFILVTDRYTEGRIWSWFENHFEAEVLHKGRAGTVRRVTGYKPVTSAEIEAAVQHDQRLLVPLRWSEQVAANRHPPLQSRGFWVTQPGVKAVRLHFRAYKRLASRVAEKKEGGWHTVDMGRIRVTGGCQDQEYKTLGDAAVDVYLDFTDCPISGPRLLSVETDFTWWRRSIRGERGFALRLFGAEVER